jgi:hypothetical protein
MAYPPHEHRRASASPDSKFVVHSRLLNPLHGLTVLDEHGEVTQLATLWHDHPVVLAFVRHFG